MSPSNCTLKPSKRNTFSADTFRPSESQKTVLLAMDQITASGRAMKKADVTTNKNEQKAFDSLVDLELVEVDEDEVATLTDTGTTVVENIKAADPALAGEEDMGSEDMDLGTEEEPPMENFKLLKGINMLTEAAFKFTQDDVKFLKLVADDKAVIEDDQKLMDKLMDFYAAEMPYGTVTGDDETPGEWFTDRIDMVLKDIARYVK